MGKFKIKPRIGGGKKVKFYYHSLRMSGGSNHRFGTHCFNKVKAGVGRVKMKGKFEFLDCL